MNLTDEEMRVRIAEACGWYLRDAAQNPIFRWCHPDYIAPHDPRPEMKGRYGCELPPDYLNDLNAMHEVEKALTEKECKRYNAELHRVVLAHDACQWPFSATARQRATAFLAVVAARKDQQS